MSVMPYSAAALAGEVVETARLSATDRRQMFELLDRYYAGVTPASFENDLVEKDWVVVARSRHDGAIRGFSTQKLLEGSGGRRVLFSGDTIVEEAHWGRNPIAAQWGHLALSIQAAEPQRELLWFLISKGYKTYRMLPSYFVEFFPRFDAPTPGWATALVDELASARYPTRYDPAAGVVRAGSDGERLRPEVAPLAAEHRTDPHLAFFAEANPGHIVGDEVCCLAPMRLDNLTPRALDLLAGADGAADERLAGGRLEVAP